MNEMTPAGRHDGLATDTSRLTSNGLKGLWYDVESILANSAKADRDLATMLEPAR